MAGMTSASMIPTIVTFLMMVMVITMYIRIISQIACKQCVHRIISTSADTAEKTNACLRKCILCAAADTAADQGIHPMLHQKSSQCTMSASVGINHFCVHNFAVCNLIDLEFCCVSKVLENLSVFISYCNFHSKISFSINHTPSILLKYFIFNDIYLERVSNTS